MVFPRVIYCKENENCRVYKVDCVPTDEETMILAEMVYTKILDNYNYTGIKRAEITFGIDEAVESLLKAGYLTADEAEKCLEISENAKDYREYIIDSLNDAVDMTYDVIFGAHEWEGESHGRIITTHGPDRINLEDDDELYELENIVIGYGLMYDVEHHGKGNLPLMLRRYVDLLHKIIESHKNGEDLSQDDINYALIREYADSIPKIRCACDNCIHQRGDGVCRLGSISLDWCGGCNEMRPATVCGMCRKFGTRDCKFGANISADEPVSSECFEPKITFVKTEEE